MDHHLHDAMHGNDLNKCRLVVFPEIEKIKKSRSGPEGGVEGFSFDREQDHSEEEFLECGPGWNPFEYCYG